MKASPWSDIKTAKGVVIAYQVHKECKINVIRLSTLLTHSTGKTWPLSQKSVSTRLFMLKRLRKQIFSYTCEVWLAVVQVYLAENLFQESLLRKSARTCTVSYREHANMLHWHRQWNKTGNDCSTWATDSIDHGSNYNLPVSETSRIAAAKSVDTVENVRYYSGAEMTVQGDDADCMYIVEDGEVSIVMRSDVRR